MCRPAGCSDEIMPNKGIVLGRRSVAQRKTDRRALGTLQSLVVAPSTHNRYFQAVSRFLEFLQLHGYRYPQKAFLLRTSEFVNSLNICGITGNQKLLPRTVLAE